MCQAVPILELLLLWHSTITVLSTQYVHLCCNNISSASFPYKISITKYIWRGVCPYRQIWIVGGSRQFAITVVASHM